MQKRGGLKCGAYFIRAKDMNNPKGAQEYYVNDKGEAVPFRHGILGDSLLRVDIPPAEVVILIRP